jgi:hypothetical protein
LPAKTLLSAATLAGTPTDASFGAFGFVKDGSCVTLQHTLLGGAALDGAELLATLRDLAMLADEYDDRIVAEAGGQTMQALLEEEEMHTIRDSVIDGIPWDGAPRR